MLDIVCLFWASSCETGLELHWGPSAKAGSTEHSLASLPRQLSDPQKSAEACRVLLGKNTARAGPLLETCTFAASQPIHPLPSHLIGRETKQQLQVKGLISCLLLLMLIC